MNQVRIIGGAWRGRKLQFPEALQLRPTLDRVRETVFNWLMPVIVGATCLDLFAGSGAFGFEALSRGAKKTVLVDKNPQVIQSLLANRQKLQATTAEIVQADGLQWLQTQPPCPLDVIFLDPPFQKKMVFLALASLQKYNWLHANTLIYIEAERALRPKLVETLEVVRFKETASLCFGLFKEKITGGIIGTRPPPTF